MDQQITSSSLDALQPKTTGALLAIGVGVGEARSCLLEKVSGQYRLVGWSAVARPSDADLSISAIHACRRLGERLGRHLWDEQQDEPLLQTADATRWPPLEHVAVGISPRARVRVWLAGLSAGMSLTAARQALASSPTHLVGGTRLSASLNSGQLADSLADAHTEALVIVGGYDDRQPASHSWILQLCRIIGQALERIPPAQRPAIFYAGNRWAAPSVDALLRTGEGPRQIELLNNLMPTPGVVQSTELAVKLGHHYWRLCQRMPGFGRINRWVTAPGNVSNLETAFAQLARAWMEYRGLNELHGLYCTNHWWVHVLTQSNQAGVQLRFVKPQTRPKEFDQWPPVQLVSGEWPRQIWPFPEVCWWDRDGLAPLVASLGQVAPLAMLQVVWRDLFASRQREGMTR